MCLLLQYLYKVCVFITEVPITKLFAWGGGGNNGGHLLRETTSRGLGGLVNLFFILLDNYNENHRTGEEHGLQLSHRLAPYR